MLNAFFGEVGEKGIEAVSMDPGPASAKSVRTRVPRVTICFGAFHVAKLVTGALDAVRRQVWQSARRLRDKTIAKKYKGARWAQLKDPDDLNTDQTGTPREIKNPVEHCGGPTSSRGPCARCSAGGPRHRHYKHPPRPLVLPSPTQPNHRIRENGPRYPETSRRDHRYHRSWPVQRTPKRDEQQSSTHHPPHLRLPHCRSRPRRRHACLRTRQPPPPLSHPTTHMQRM